MLLGVIIFLKLEFNTDDITSVEVPVIVDDKNVPKKEVLVTPILDTKEKEVLEDKINKETDLPKDSLGDGSLPLPDFLPIPDLNPYSERYFENPDNKEETGSNLMYLEFIDGVDKQTVEDIVHKVKGKIFSSLSSELYMIVVPVARFEDAVKVKNILEAESNVIGVNMSQEIIAF